jgi:hypothetical protein
MILGVGVQQIGQRGRAGAKPVFDVKISSEYWVLLQLMPVLVALI